MNAQSALIHIANVSRRYGGLMALDDVTLMIKGPGVVAVIGPNGCGKSTLLHVLSGLVRPDSGICRVGDVNCGSASPQTIAASGVARTFQQPRVLRSLSVLDNLLLAAAPGSDERLMSSIRGGANARDRSNHLDRCRSFLKDFDLADEAATPAGLLSYGQQRLTGLAAALAASPRVLLLDEPGAGLSRRMLEKAREKLSEAARSTVIVMAEHEPVIVERLASRIVKMQKGRIVSDEDSFIQATQ